MQRISFFLFGVLSYAIFFGTFLYAIGFIGNFAVPKAMDSAGDTPLGLALLINTALLGLFAVQHSVMARPGFKRWWTKIVPEPIERSVYVLFSSLAMILMFWQWRPLGGVVWNIENEIFRTVLWVMYGFGWVTVLVSTFLINHFDLFGLRQVYLHLRGKKYTGLNFVTPGPYRYIRHPLYVGWLCVFWFTPTMSVTHLVFALVTSVYILVAIRLEERDLVNALGDKYDDYRSQVPMLIPSAARKYSASPTPRSPRSAPAGQQ